MIIAKTSNKIKKVRKRSITIKNLQTGFGIITPSSVQRTYSNVISDLKLNILKDLICRLLMIHSRLYMRQSYYNIAIILENLQIF